MGLLSSLYAGVSGMNAQGEALGVIGDNIANANTTGYKASRTEFQDIISKSLKGILGGNQVGRGVKIGGVNPILAQGNVDPTEKSTDLAISGDGYFVLNGVDGQSFTRDGTFHFDKEGYLVNSDNMKVQGFEADENSRILNKLGNIRFPKTLTPAKPTTKIRMDMNLDSRADTNRKFDEADPFISCHFSNGVELFDSQGNKHLMTTFFNKVGDGEWEYRGMVDGKEVTGGDPGKLKIVCEGRIKFNVDGLLETEEITKSAFNFKGGALQDQKIKIDFGDSIKTDGGKGAEGTKQYGRDSDLITWQQDGAAAGTITNMSFNDQGILTVLYSNGEARDLAQVCLAKFENPESLFKIGNNRLKASREAGTPSIGISGQGGRGILFAKSLERSTVDLGTEFVSLIQTQRGFQSNAKTITTTDQLLEEVLNLKR